MNSRARTRGELVRRALAGAWREAPPPPSLSASELEAALPLLLATGSGALVWHRLRGSPLERTRAGETLRQAHRLAALEASVRERELAEALTTLEAAGIPALLLKGWLAARHYPHDWLRSYTDHDLCVSEDDLPGARAALAAVEVRVDLHGDVRQPGHGVRLERSFDHLLAEARPVEVGGVRGRALGAEDHLAVLCLHALKHGLWRPIWLCDVAAALEARPTDLAWGRFIDGAGAMREWLGVAIRLAHRLLGASLEDVPARLVQPQPPWLERAVLVRWGTHPGAVAGVGGIRKDMLAVRGGRELANALKTRWPGPIEASIARGAGAPERSPLRTQLAIYSSQALRFGLALPQKLRHERRRRAVSCQLGPSRRAFPGRKPG